MARYFYILIGCLVLSACHFEPLYAKAHKAKVSQEIQDIIVPEIPSREGQKLRNELRARIAPYGESSAPKYKLEVALKYARGGIAVQDDGTFQRFNIIGTTSFVLRSMETNKILYKDSITRSSSYYVSDSNAQSAYSATVSERGVRLQIATALADQILLNVSSHLARGDQDHAAQ